MIQIKLAMRPRPLHARRPWMASSTRWATCYRCRSGRPGVEASGWPPQRPELGINVEALIGRLVGGGFAAVGREYGEDMPIPIPREHFAVPLREKRKAGPEDVAALVQLGYAIPSDTRGRWNG